MPVLRAAICVLLCLQFAAAQNQSTPPSAPEQPPAAQQPAAPADQNTAKPDATAKPENAAGQQSPETKPQEGQAPAGGDTKQPTGAAPQVTPALTGFGLEDGTPVKLRLTRNLSSASEKKGDTVDFEVVEDLNVSGVLVIPRGSAAWATITEAQPKRRMARGGELDVNIDNVRLKDGEKVALRAVKENKGGGHVGAMTGAMVATGIVFFPAAPLFLFMHGKDINIPKGTEITAYVAGNIPLDKAKFQDTDHPQGTTVAAGLTAAEADAMIALVSNPDGAEVTIDDAFMGNAPAKLRLKAGKHTIKVSMAGYKDWTREMTVMSGSEVNLAANLEKTN
ncbi:MAG TPA: PEGA domain-containing protein [Alphaproteobacteria bacterium]|nr:PEGA domain-containing protein [Alphaproteobacteria bacterium]